jgi:hypothetical protein
MGTIPGFLQFYWTTGFDPVTKMFIPANYQKYTESNTGRGYITRFFYPPNDPAIKDWAQQVTDGQGHKSDVQAGAIKHQSPWTFFSLSDLPNVGYKIPDFAAIGDSSITIYEAVNLDLYIASNPDGIVGGNYAVGQTLTGLGVNIINGQVPGIQGLYFSLSPFTFDPNSLTGYVPSGGDSTLLNSSSFEAEHGELGIIGIRQQVAIPKPSAWLLAAAGLVCVLSARAIHRAQRLQSRRAPRRVFRGPHLEG